MAIELKEVMEAVAELRQEVAKVSPDQEKINRIEKVLADQEAENQKLVAAQSEATKSYQEAKERIDALEADLARAAPSAGLNYKDTEEFKAFNKYVIEGKDGMEVVEIKTLRTDSDVNGGYLAPSEMDNQITKKITEISNIRSIARVRTISSKSLEMAIRNTIPQATYEGELETGSDSHSTYGNETLTPFRQTFTTPISLDMLMDSAFDMEAEIMSDASEAFAYGEGVNFISGTGFKQPEGFLTNADVLANVRTSTTSATIDPEDVILLTGDLKVGYQPVYVMNRRTLAFLRTLKSTTGQFLWAPGMNGPVANTLNGFPYLIADAMPDIASNSLSIAFGDFRRGYTITDRTGLAVIRDEYTLKKQGAVEFTMNRWNTGQVTLPEAIKVLKTKA